MKKVSTLLIMTLISIILAAGCSSKSSSVDKKQEITVYTAIEDAQIPVYLEAFEKVHPGIEVKLVRDSTGIIAAKLLAEKDNPIADVVWGTGITNLMPLDELGLFEPYNPKGIDKILPELKDKADPVHWVGIDAYMATFAVNTVELENKGLPIPKSYEDLLDPKYKGLISMPNPASSGTGFLTVSALIQLMGEDGAYEYLDKLHDNIGIYTHSGSKPAKLAGQGEFPIGISFDYPSFKEKESGAPIEVVFPKEGSGWEMEANTLVKKPEIKEAAKTFLDWAVSKEALELVNKNFAVVSIDLGNALPEGYPNNLLEKQLIDNDFQWAAKQRESILEEWTKRYDSKSEPKE
ncbi:putative 2-aminoethylphosphonate ABC transporter substrate-binding protein [Neobacillus niacini]|uniref:putative 2-aminoethylphosphonate ABC transporter substrate-binding protein n=1 Tax=Neobacillus niacini TaxID=86668 RepID=UPI00052F62F9|nr:putative 2-aminoethylphosphonate ABC transporter substrate-binding protein [Neobacillus niacini]KGM44708.1 iron ABC transporter substrate-binding protein [Neobacillus niacini]MEC1525361.1 putative 2-aminoethylphosphonate ABC transporter substrate-binding protein [Neobacillus niacini]